jgi:transcription termination factor Rho
MEESTCPVVLQVDEVMGVSPEEATRVTPFTELTPYYPLKRMYLETHHEVEWDNVAMRVVDLVSPVGFGQRGLIVPLQERERQFYSKQLHGLYGKTTLKLT